MSDHKPKFNKRGCIKTQRSWICWCSALSFQPEL